MLVSSSRIRTSYDREAVRVNGKKDFYFLKKEVLMADLYVYIGRKIRELRKHHMGKGVDQETVAAAVGSKANTVSRWESATYRPSLRDLEKLSRYFGVSISVFFPEMQDSRLQALMSATGDLRDDEFEELLEYARFRKARQMLRDAGKPKKSRAR
jgi:transcriptional regulator with XRE-family HTH domain